MESLYALLVRPPIEIGEQIKVTAQKVFTDLEFEPHISLGSALNCTRKNLAKKTKEWLEMQKQFVFTLRKVGNFTKMVYLTSDNQEEIDEIGDLYYGLKSLLETEIRDRQNNPTFIPHLTLQDSVQSKDIEKTAFQFGRVFCDPIAVPITEVEIREKVSRNRWETLDLFKIGGEKERNQSLPVEGYQFNQSDRRLVD